MMYEAKHYETKLWWSDEDDAFLAQITELPSLMAHGDTGGEAVENVHAALTVALDWMQERGEELPVPIYLQAAA